MSSIDQASERQSDPARGAPGTRGTGRVLVVLFICAGIAFSGLLAGGEHERAGARIVVDKFQNPIGQAALREQISDEHDVKGLPRLGQEINRRRLKG